MRIVLVTGMSGSGKSVAIRLLEDIGYYCIDNLPPQFLVDVCSYLGEAGQNDIAVSIDARSQSTLAELPDIVGSLRTFGNDAKVLFLTSSTLALVQRYSESRRRHPMAERVRREGREPTLVECIEAERDLLAPLESMGHEIDTSDLHPNALRTWVKQFVDTPRSPLTLTFESFAYKRGVPVAADLVFDVRNLPNPYYDPKLRALTGRDAPVIEFLKAAPLVGEMVDDIAGFVEKWLPSYVADNRHYVTVAIGCTGGQHRSVYIVEELARRFALQERVLVRHRVVENI